MPSMSEDALFKAVLKNKPGQGTQTAPKPPVKNDIKESLPRPASASSEDAMYRALLKNRPAQTAQTVQKPQAQARNEPAIPVPAAPQVVIQEIPTVKPSPVIEEVKGLDIEAIQDLNASVNMVHSLMKTVIVPVLILILIVGIAVLIKMS